VTRRADSLGRPLALFALLALAALALVAGTGVVVIRRVATDQALAEARQVTEVSARLVERRLHDGLLTGGAIASGAVARIVHDAVLVEPVVRAKLWTRDGEIVYSDEARLIGSTYDLDDDDLQVLDEGGVVSEVSDLSRPENRFERSFGELLEVYTRVETSPGRTPLLFETYQRASSIAERRRELTATFVPVLVATLVALALLMVPLAWILASRVRGSQRERERLMQRAIESSDRERRRIAADLHDGPVQEMAGLSMRLSAAAGRAADGASAEVLQESASAVRGSVRTLRSAVVGVYPPNLQQVGLAASLSDLLARLASQGVHATVEVDPAETFGPDVDALVYRAAQEAVRNVEEHAGASTVRIVVTRADGAARLEVTDDGRGIDDARIEQARREGHVGLSILEDVVADGGGRLSVRPRAPTGTVVRVEVPMP